MICRRHLNRSLSENIIRCRCLWLTSNNCQSSAGTHSGKGWLVKVEFFCHALEPSKEAPWWITYSLKRRISWEILGRWQKRGSRSNHLLHTHQGSSYSLRKLLEDRAELPELKTKKRLHWEGWGGRATVRSQALPHLQPTRGKEQGAEGQSLCFWMASVLCQPVWDLTQKQRFGKHLGYK